MSRYATVTAEVDVEVCISEFDTEDLLDELDSRGYGFESNTAKETLQEIYLLRRQGQSYEHLMDNLVYQVLGRLV